VSNSNFIASWSSGKDSCLATLQALGTGKKVKGLVTVLNENGKVSRSHATPLHILEQQSAAIGVPLFTVPASWKEYEMKFVATLKDAAQSVNAGLAVFGDIDIDANRKWEEDAAIAAGIVAVLPLWKQNRHDLVYQMIECGIEAIIVSCNRKLGKDFLGKSIDAETVIALEYAGVDVCGENGEYHTLVVNSPFFASPVEYQIVEKKQHDHYCFLEII